MELKRILAKDSRTAMDLAMARYGKDVLVVSSQSVNGQVELVVALDVAPEPAAAPAPAPSKEPSAFTQAFRRALGPMPEPEPEPEPAGLPESASAAAVLEARLLAQSQSQGHSPAGAALASTAPAPAGRLAAPQAASNPAAPAAGAERAPATDAAARDRQVVDLVRRELAALRQEFALGRQVQAWADTQAWPVAVQPVVHALNDAGVPAGLRALLLEGARQAADAAEALDSMRQQMAGALSALPTFAIDRGVHAICGPSGAGKTHMVTRLARAAALRQGAERVAIITFNDQRVGAWSQVRVLATQAGVACYRAGDEAALRLLLDELSGLDFVLVDTAGVDCEAQARALRAMDAGIRTHLLVPADASIGSVRRLLAAGQGWSSLMVGKVDECASPWPLVQSLCERPLPVACMSASGDVAAPARGFDAQRLLDAAFGRLQADMEACLEARLDDAPDAALGAGMALSVPAAVPVSAPPASREAAHEAANESKVIDLAVRVPRAPALRPATLRAGSPA